MAKMLIKKVINRRTTSLPVKITFIVYWFLAIAAAGVSVPLMNHMENDLVKEFSFKSKSVQAEVQEMLYYNALLTSDALLENLSRTRVALDIPAIEIRIDGGPVYRSGELSSQIEADILMFEVFASDSSRKLIQLSVYHTLLNTAIYDLRKNFILLVGTFFLLFGAALTIILRHIIARPFSIMVKTAKAFSEGDQDTRFNIASSDEFGYLAKFINRILDQLLQQRDDLKSAFSNLKKSEIKLSKEKKRIEVTLDSIGDAVITTNDKGVIDYLNPTAEVLLGVSRLLARGKNIDEVVKLVDEETNAPIANPVLPCLENNDIIEQSDKSIFVSVGSKLHAVSYIVAPMETDNKVVGAVMVLHDVEQTRQLSRELSYQASHDTLTHLYNRRAFEEQVEIALINATKNREYHALCYLDLDRFKVVNDTCGHLAGDALLQQLSELISSRSRNTDLVARLGGDEFGVLLQHCTAADAAIIAQDIVDIICNFHFSWEGRLFETGVSAGLVAITPESQTLDQVLTSADMACYIAKERGRGQVHVYEPDDAELNQRRGEMQWVPKLKEALENNQFRLYYQPIVPTDDKPSSEIHFEVLLRLLDENNNLIPPNTFIPAAERFQLMPNIDRWVITNTFNFLRDNIDPGLNYICSINLSGQSLSDDELMDYVEQMLASNIINPSNICFEITETAAISHLDKAKRFMEMLNQLGCRFSLDDFGSGLSSFLYLKDLRVDYLKIDGFFIKDIANNPVDYAMVKSINDIGHILKIKTIAEFVDNDQAAEQLKALGVNYIQGYAVARPAPISELPRWTNVNKALQA